MVIFVPTYFVAIRWNSCKRLLEEHDHSLAPFKVAPQCDTLVDNIIEHRAVSLRLLKPVV